MEPDVQKVPSLQAEGPRKNVELDTGESICMNVFTPTVGPPRKPPFKTQKEKWLVTPWIRFRSICSDSDSTKPTPGLGHVVAGGRQNPRQAEVWDDHLTEANRVGPTRSLGLKSRMKLKRLEKALGQMSKLWHPEN